MRKPTPHHFLRNFFSPTLFRKSGGGFTLAEFLIIVGIIGILLLVSIPAFRSFQPDLQLGGSVRNLVSDLRYTQQLAVTEQVEHSVLFYPPEKKYAIIRYGGETQVIKEILLPEEIISLVISPLSNNEIKYNPYGAVKEAGTITLENIENKTKTIEVKPSGFVKITD